MNPTDLAGMLELMAQALRSMPAGAGGAASVASPAPVAAPDGRPLGEWLDVYARLLLERGYKQQTVKNRTANLNHVRRLWGSAPINGLRPHQISSALREFLPKRSSTARRVLAELRDVYTEAVHNDWAQNNPASLVRPPAHKIKRQRLQIETWQSMRTLAKASSQRLLESLLLLALATGQRRGDLAKMRFDHIVDGHLQVEQQKEAGKGFGARVAIPMSLRLDAIGMTVADVIEHCRGSAKPGPTLLRKAGGGAIEESSLSTRFRECLVAVLGPTAHKEHEWPTLHEVRSLAAREYVRQGLSREAVQTLLGHKDAEMTAVYTDDRGLSAGEWKRVVAPA